MRHFTSIIAALMLTIAAGAQTLNINQGNVIWQYPAALTGEMTYTGGNTLTVLGHDFSLANIKGMAVSSDELTNMQAVIPAEQSSDNSVAIGSELSGIHLNFQMTGVTKVVLESVDKNAIGGTGVIDNGEWRIDNSQSIITFSAPEGSTFTPGKDYYITTFPCDLYGGYGFTIYKDGQIANYYGVHQNAEAGSYITPTDLVESELEFRNPEDPFEENERPELDSQTQQALSTYRKNPTEENKQALLDMMGVKYDKVVARKKAKLRELEREAKHQDLVDEMQAIVDEMVDNREIRLEQQFWRLVDPRTDDNPEDEWCVLRGAEGNNPYIGYAPVTNEEWKLFQTDFTYQTGQDRYPVCNVTYADAVAYCDWLSANDTKHTYRLPSEEDWILGAGHMPKDVKMNSNHVESGLTSVDAYKETTGACGGIDFWGNSWEWTSTINAKNEYIVKGGAWDSDRDSCRTEYSDDSRDGTKGYANVGFRVVREDR